MKTHLLTSAAALTFGLVMAAPVHAQLANSIPLCENSKGRLWSDIIDGKKYKLRNGFTEPVAIETLIDGVTELTEPDGSPCKIELDGVDLLVAGRASNDGSVVARKRDIRDAAKRTGIRLTGPKMKAEKSDTGTEDQGAAEAQADEAQAAEEQATAQVNNQSSEQQAQVQQDPENRTGNTTFDNGALAEVLQEQIDAATSESQPEVQQDDTTESTQAANEVVETQAASNDDADQSEVVQVETQTVTEADTRSSDEDFSTSVSAQGNSNSNDGLSNIEKFALGALGVVVAGQVLDNGNKVVSNSGDRVVVERQDGAFEVLKDDNALLRRPGVKVQTKRFSDGSTRETLTRENGVKIVTIKTSDGQVLRRTRVKPDGTRIVLFDDTVLAEPVDVTQLPEINSFAAEVDGTDTDQLRAALAAEDPATINRRFTLQQIRQIRAVRELVPVVELDAVTFDTGSAAIRPSEAEELRDLGVAMQRAIEANPYEVFLVEGHTDAVGSATYNLALSDRRAESVALALTEYFNVAPENMVVQGYGEANLKIRTLGDERANRRATVRRITPLLQAQVQ